MDVRFKRVEDVLRWGTCDVWDGNYGEPQYLHPEAMGWVLQEWREDLNGDEFLQIRADMRSGGWDVRYPARYAIIENVPVLMDGHHRLALAVELGLESIPVALLEPSHDRVRRVASILRAWRGDLTRLDPTV